MSEDGSDWRLAVITTSTCLKQLSDTEKINLSKNNR